MSRKEVPHAGLLKAALVGKISNAQGAQALHPCDALWKQERGFAARSKGICRLTAGSS